MTYRCKRCHRPIWVPESVIRGMGPICYGKSYTIRRLLSKGISKEEIQKIPKEELERLAKEEVKLWKKMNETKKKNKINKIRKVNGFRIKKVDKRKDKAQRTLDSFLEIEPLVEITISEENTEIEELKEELNDILRVLPKSTGWKGTDRALELIGKINKLEGQKND